MRLRSQKVLILLGIFVFACRDTTGTTGPETINAHFILENIDGRALPTRPSLEAGVSTTIVGGLVVFNESGEAGFSELRIDVDGTHSTYAWTYTYKIVDHKVTFTPPPCPANANCAAPPTGIVIGNRLMLEWGSVSVNPIVYNYSLIVQPELPH